MRLQQDQRHLRVGARRLLTEVLREEWGLAGLVVSDWGAVHDRVAALRAGLDLEMPPHIGVSDAAVVAAVRSGELDEAVLDASVRRVLQLVDRSRPALDDEATFDADAPSRAGAAGGARGGRAAAQRRRRAAAASNRR
ncbi:MAG TPA: glycoside hydrolase family 3 N-terminal domain-containing protein [Euzebyales bacterium]